MKYCKIWMFFALLFSFAFFVSAQTRTVSDSLKELNDTVKKFNDIVVSLENAGGQYVDTVITNNASTETKFFLDGQISQLREMKSLILTKNASVLNEYESICLMYDNANKLSLSLNTQLETVKKDNERIAAILANPMRYASMIPERLPLIRPKFEEYRRPVYEPLKLYAKPSPQISLTPQVLNVRPSPPIRLTPQEEFQISVYKQINDIIVSITSQTQKTLDALKKMNSDIIAQTSANEQSINSNRSLLNSLNAEIDAILTKVTIAYTQSDAKKAELAELQKLNSIKEAELVQLRTKNTNLREEAKRKGIEL